MERFDIKFFTNAWAKRYQDSMRGVFMPPLGRWNAKVGWETSEYKLYIGNNTFINPAPLVCIVNDVIRDKDLEVTISYSIAKLDSWEQEQFGNRRYDYPVYVHDQDKVSTFTIPAYTDTETITRICPDDNLIYKINDVTVADHRSYEEFSIWALASPTTRLIYSMKWWELYENAVKIRRGIWTSLRPCTTCLGTKLVDGETCPHCEGFGFDGVQARDFMLDNHGFEEDLSRHDGEDDYQYIMRIWMEKWWKIPTKEEILRFFKFFCHCGDDAVDILESRDQQEPTFFVLVDPMLLGTRAVWTQEDEWQDYDSVVERMCPAGVNGYFRWMIQGSGDPIEETNVDIIDMEDGSSDEQWDDQEDEYGNLYDSSEYNEALYDELDDWSEENVFHDFEEFDEDDDILLSSTKWALIEGGTFLAHEIDGDMFGRLKAAAGGTPPISVYGLFPILSGTSFTNYTVKFDTYIPSTHTGSHALEVGLTELSKVTVYADWRIHLYFLNDGTIWYRIGANYYDTGLTWSGDVVENFIIHAVSTTEFRLSKRMDGEHEGKYYQVSKLLYNKNAWTGGIQYITSSSPSDSGVCIGDIIYSW